jgi:putative membrane protein
MKLLLAWALNTIALFIVTAIVPGVHLAGLASALWAVVVLGLINAVIRPIFILLTLPVTFLTLGLFLFVINALMFWFAGGLLSGFHVDGFVAALLGSIAYSIASWFLSSLVHKHA